MILFLLFFLFSHVVFWGRLLHCGGVFSVKKRVHALLASAVLAPIPTHRWLVFLAFGRVFVEIELGVVVGNVCDIFFLLTITFGSDLGSRDSMRSILMTASLALCSLGLMRPGTSLVFDDLDGGIQKW